MLEMDHNVQKMMTNVWTKQLMFDKKQDIMFLIHFVSRSIYLTKSSNVKCSVPIVQHIKPKTALYPKSD